MTPPPPQQTDYLGPMCNQCWSTAYDAGPTLDQHIDQRIVPAVPYYYSINIRVFLLFQGVRSALR